MTTYIDFQPSQQQVFRFQPLLDGDTYDIEVVWSLFGQRYYLNCSALNGERLFSLPLVGSPNGKTIESCTWDGDTVFVKLSRPHKYELGSITRVNISRCVPDTFNGDFEVSVETPDTVSYSQMSDPGNLTTPGLMTYNINIVAAYFNESTLVYRTGSNQFEITP